MTIDEAYDIIRAWLDDEYQGASPSPTYEALDLLWVAAKGHEAMPIDWNTPRDVAP